MSRPQPTWVWEDNVLRDQQKQVVALVRADVIFVGEHRLLVESTPGPLHFRFRATAENGEMITMRQTGFTVHSLEANCGDRHYTLQRNSPLRKERTIERGGQVVAKVSPYRTTLGVYDITDFPLLDAVVLTWGCVLVDVPARNMRIS